jgi:hypothetical protein
MNAQLAKMEKKFTDLVKNSNAAPAASGQWETGNPHTTAWACLCGFQNFKSRTVCMKCQAAKQEPRASGAGQAAAAPGVPTAGAPADATATPAAAAASKPDEELAFWRAQHRYLGTTAAGPGKVLLLAQAEGMIADLTKEVKACKPLAARFQASEARLQAATKSYSAALDAVTGLEQQLMTACEALAKEAATVEEAEADVLATRAELAAPGPAPAAMDTMEVIQQVLNQLVTMGVVQVSAGTEVTLQAALGTVVEEVLKPAPTQARVEKVPDVSTFDPNAMDMAEPKAGPGTQLALISASSSSAPLGGTAPGAGALAMAATALESAKASVAKGAARITLESGNYGAQREKSGLRVDPMGRPVALSPTPPSA